MAAEAVAERLNSRFRNGGPSSDLSAAGVLMRNFEGMAGRHTQPWEPCSDDEYCARASDRLAASLVNARMTHLWSSVAGGVVVSPPSARLLCAFHGDGNNFARFCKPPTEWLKMAAAEESDGSPCVPGCTSSFGWCDDHVKPCPLCEEVKCAWRPAALPAMVLAHQSKLSAWGAAGRSCAKGGHEGRSSCHNELVLDAEAWTQGMPHTVEAVFYQRGSGADAKELARTVHTDFLRRYGLDAQATPLLVYDASRSDTGAPFTVAPENERAAAQDASR